eukprot:363567-Chlamydomonas_euryale.AAC.2
MQQRLTLYPPCSLTHRCLFSPRLPALPFRPPACLLTAAYPPNPLLLSFRPAFPTALRTTTTCPLGPHYLSLHYTVLAPSKP